MLEMAEGLVSIFPFGKTGHDAARDSVGSFFKPGPVDDDEGTTPLGALTLVVAVVP